MELSTIAVHSDAEKFIRRIKTLGITKQHVAKQLDISLTHLSLVLNGKRDMTEDLRKRIGDYLDSVITGAET